MISIYISNPKLETKNFLKHTKELIIFKLLNESLHNAKDW